MKVNYWAIKNIPEEVKVDAKVNAAMRRQTLGQYVTEALRYYNKVVTSPPGVKFKRG